MKTKIYYAPLPPLPLYPSTADMYFNQPGIVRENGYAFDEIFIVKDGNGILEIDGKTYALEKNDMFFLRKNTPHQYYAVGDKFVTCYLSFFGSSKESLYEYYKLGSFGVYKSKNLAKVESHLKELYENFDSLQELSTLSAMTYSCVTAFFDEACKKEYTPLEKVYNYLEANYSTPITLEDILSFYPYSKTKLCTEFKSAYEKSIFDVLTEIRISHAREMLFHNPHIALKNIAEASGFGDVSYFCKVYKKLIGTTPKSSYPRESGR